MLLSLANEDFTDANKQLFGPGFEQRLKARSETAETIGKAAKVGKPFFRGMASRGFPRPRGGRPWTTFQSFCQTSPRPNLFSRGRGTRGKRPVYKISKPTFSQSTNIQIQPTVKHSRPSNLPQGMFINFLHPLDKQTGFPLTGRLKYFTSTWEKITQVPWVLQVVQGYQIEFMKPPVQLVPARMPSLTPTLETVLDQVQELLNKGAVHLVKQPVVTEGFISSLFVVPKKDGGNRPVVNLKPLNQYITYKHFKMEGIHMLRDLLKLGDWLVKIDLKDAYLTVPIWINHQK